MYSSKDGDAVEAVRFALCRHGEDPGLCLNQFFEEHASADFQIALVWSFGLPPRRALSTKRSILAALDTIMPEPGSQMEQRWQELCRDLGVVWPRHLQEVA